MTKKISHCKYCNKIIPQTKGTKPRLFCNVNCSVSWRYHNILSVKKRMKQTSKQFHEKNKNDPKYKQAQKRRFNKWLNKNRKQFNKDMREIMRKRKLIQKQNNSTLKIKKLKGGVIENNGKSI